MATIPAISLSRYVSYFRSQPGMNWLALALQQIESTINQIIGSLNAGPGGVTKIVAGRNVTISPADGSGAVTISAAAGSTASGLSQLTGDVAAGPGSGSQAATVKATHLTAPLPVTQGGTGTAAPGLVAGANVTISGSWPYQTVSAAATGISQLTGDVAAGPGSGSQAATVKATHLTAPLPVAQGGTGTTTPGLVSGTGITISGSWPAQTVSAPPRAPISHSEPLTDDNANFIFAAGLSTGGDVVCVVGVPN